MSKHAFLNAFFKSEWDSVFIYYHVSPPQRIFRFRFKLSSYLTTFNPHPPLLTRHVSLLLSSSLFCSFTPGPRPKSYFGPDLARSLLNYLGLGLRYLRIRGEREREGVRRVERECRWDLLIQNDDRRRSIGNWFGWVKSLIELRGMEIEDLGSRFKENPFGWFEKIGTFVNRDLVSSLSAFFSSAR